MLKILQPRLQQYTNHELLDVQAAFRKGRGIRDQIANICWIIKKAREFQKKHLPLLYWLCQSLDYVDHNKLWKILKEMGTPDYLTCLLRNPYAVQEATVKEIVFNPLYILASFVKDKVSICAWIYLWAFYFVPLIYISVFCFFFCVPVPYCFNDWGFVVEPDGRQDDSSSSIHLSQDCFAYLRFFVFPYKLWNY